jgi:ABC-type transport system substrate-binding protein
VQRDLSDRFGIGGLGLAAALAVAALASACNTSEAVSRDADPASVRAPTAASSAWSWRLHHIDPVAVDSVYDALPVGQIFDGLVALDPGLNTSALATRGRSRGTAASTRFICGRRPLPRRDAADVADVVFSLKRLLDPTRKRKSIGVVPAGGRRRARVQRGTPRADGRHRHRREPRGDRLTRPYLSLLEVLAMDDLRIVPWKAVTAMGTKCCPDLDARRWQLLGTGTELVLTANPDYFGGAPYLERVVILFPRPDEHDGGNARFSRGETEMVEPTSDTLPSLLADPEVEVHRYQDLSLSFMGLNTGIPPLDDVRVRRAIAYAIDRKALAAVSPATRREEQGILPPGLPSYSPAPKALPYDPEAARRLLTEAGHPGGRGLPPLRFYTAQSESTAVAKSIEQMTSNLAAVGITLDVHRVPWRELNARVEDNVAPSFQLGWVADLPDPDSFLRTLFEPGSSANYFDFMDKETGLELERGASETNPLERARIYREIEKTVLDKAPLVPLFHSMGMIASRRTVHGLKSGPMGIGALALEHVWIDADGSTR